MFSLSKTRGRRPHSGLTLVEIMVVAAVSLVLMITVFTLVKRGLASFRQGSNKLNYLHETNRLLYMLRHDLEFLSGNLVATGNSYQFEKWSDRNTGSGETKTIITYRLENHPAEHLRGRQLIRSDSGNTGSPGNLKYGRGLIKKFKLTQDGKFIVVAMVISAEENPDSDRKQLELSTLILPRESESSRVRDHWVPNPKKNP